MKPNTNAVIFHLTDRSNPNPAADITRFFRNGLTGNWVIAGLPRFDTDTDNPIYVGLAYNGMIIACGTLAATFPVAGENRVLVLCRDVEYHGKPYTYESSNPNYAGHQNPVKYAVYDPATNTFNPNV